MPLWFTVILHGRPQYFSVFFVREVGSIMYPPLLLLLHLRLWPSAVGTAMGYLGWHYTSNHAICSSDHESLSEQLYIWALYLSPYVGRYPQAWEGYLFNVFFILCLYYKILLSLFIRQDVECIFSCINNPDERPGPETHRYWRFFSDYWREFGQHMYIYVLWDVCIDYAI